MIASTSIQNYREHRDSGKLGTQARAVLEFFRRLPPGKEFSRLELSRAIDMRLSSVCGRVNELVSAGFLEPAPHRKCNVSGKTVSPVRLVTGLEWRSHD